MAGLSSLTATISTECKWVAQNTLTGSVYNPVSNSGDIRKSYNLGTAIANALAGGADEVFSFQQAIAGAGSATIDLNALTNVLQQAAVAIVRIKGYQIRLLSAADDATITTPVSTAVLVTNNGPAVPSPLDFGNGGSGLTIALVQSGGVLTSVSLQVAGTGYPAGTAFMVAPNQAGGAGAVASVITNGSGVPTSATLITGVGGSGYSNANVPTTVLGQYVINSGGTHEYFDVLAAGFIAVSTTSRNIKIINLHATSTATVEITVFGGTT